MSSLLGGLTLPIAAGAQNSDLDDPVVSALSEYLRFWLRNELNTKLSNMQGTATDACPSANVFKVDPSTYWSRGPFPALYVWWEGSSEFQRYSLVYDLRIRKINAMWVYDELLMPEALQPRHGLLNAVDSVFFKATERQRHASFAYGSAAPGAPLAWSVAAPGLVSFRYDGGQAGVMAPVPDSDPTPGGPGEGQLIRGYPALRGVFTVWERIEPGDTDDESFIEGTLNLDGTDGEGEPDDFMSRTLTAPDGDD